MKIYRIDEDPLYIADNLTTAVERWRLTHGAGPDEEPDKIELVEDAPLWDKQF